MSDWRKAHKKKMMEKQRHISQKQAHLREYRALVLKWGRNMRNLRDWFNGLETSTKSSKWFSIQSMIRMGSVMVQINQMIAEFEQIGSHKTIGSGSKSTGSKYSEAQRQAGVAVDVLVAKAGPLANTAPWDLVWDLDPDTSESIKQGKYVAAATNAIMNPVTSLGATFYADEIFDKSIELIKGHPEEFKNLEKGWKDTQKTLNSISNDLNNIDLGQLDKISDGLEETLKKYESAYNGASGADNTDAHLLRKLATRK